MKLRNKQTPNKFGEIVPYDNKGNVGIAVKTDQGIVWYYHSLDELNEEWEDYEEPKEYWHIDFDGSLMQTSDIKCDKYVFDKLKEIGNYFETKEEAEKAVEKLKAVKRLKDNGFRFQFWTSSYSGDNISFFIDWINADSKKEIEEALDLLFGGEE